MNWRDAASSIRGLPLLGAALAFWVLFSLTVDFAGEWSAPALQTGILLTASAWLTVTAVGVTSPQLHWLIAPLVFAALWGPVQVLLGWSIYSFVTVEQSLAWSAALAFFLLGLQVMSDPDAAGQFLRWLPFAGGAISILAILQLLTSTGRVLWIFETGYDDQVLGPFVSRNHYSAFALLIFPVAVWFACRKSRWQIVYAASAGLLFASVVAGASRAGSLLLLAELVCLLGSLLRGSVRWVPAATVLGFVIATTAIIGPESLWTRLQNAEAFGLRASLNRSSVRMISERPWTGFGLGAWPEVYPGYALEDVGRHVNRAHNDWAEWFAAGGLPFVAALLIVALASFVLSRRRPWGLGVPAVFLHSLVDYPLRKPAVLLLALLILAALSIPQNPGSLAGRERSRSTNAPT